MTRRFPCLTSLLNLELFLESLYTRVGLNLLGLMVERSSHRVWTTWMRDARNIKDSAVEEGAHGLAMYATVCQRNGLVPIIEPDIGRGGDHTALTCLKVTEMVLATVYKALADHHVFLEGTLLKPNMVTSGTKCESQADPQEVASLTLLPFH